MEWPYSLRVAAMICVESGDKERALKYLNLLCELILAKKATSVAWCRMLAPIILEGALGRATGETGEGAEKDAETIISAFRSWPTTREPRRLAREAEARKFADLSTDALLEILEPLKDSDDGSLRKRPVTASAISDTEARLGLALPEDYHAFLGTSNRNIVTVDGSITGPSAEEAADLGLDELEVTLGLTVDERERELLPKMSGLLMISAAEDEEQDWCGGTGSPRPSSIAPFEATSRLPQGKRDLRREYLTS
ncbi:hypothetical protein FB451DRAFT_1358889 [Mycena latifolia]|nr:hypothetical protein FB451DRAFT_1358889 [Mycena latifolia]